MTRREPEIVAFLNDKGWGQAERAAMAGDASSRRFFRLSGGPMPWRNAVLMDAGPDQVNANTAFVSIGAWLNQLGLSAPQTIAADAAAGLMIVEDLGDGIFHRAAAGARFPVAAAYRTSINTLRYLHQIAAPTNSELGYDLPVHDLSVYVPQTRLLLEYYVPDGNVPRLTTGLDELISAACSQLHQPMPVLVLRDFHAGNLLWLPERQGFARIGLLDYQDALAGHPAYDLASLLQDARIDFASGFAAEMLGYYLRDHADPVTFQRDYAILGAQRNLRLLGIFARLAQVYGKTSYLVFLPRVWRHLQDNLSHPDLRQLRDWVVDHVPAPRP